MNTEKKRGPKVRFVVQVEQDDGTIVERTIEAGSEMLPAPEDFDTMTRDGFLRDFGVVEKFLLQSRDQITDAAFDAYMEAVKKTNPAN